MKYAEQRAQLVQALTRLEEALAMERSTINRDAAIQRFEFTLDLAWKALKSHLEIVKGIVCASPKDCFRAAFRVRLLDEDPVWCDLVDYRNLTAHTYKEELAEKVYAQLPNAAKQFRMLLERLPEQ